jgi:opacity protein-like surface antigen
VSAPEPAIDQQRRTTIMNRIRVIGLALVALFSLSAVASASAHEYNAKSTPVVAKGENHTFTAGEATITCKKAEFTYGGAVGKFGTIKVTPAYKECKVLGVNATVTVEGAEYEFGAPKEIKANEFSGQVSIVGASGAKIKIVTKILGETCEVTFGTQAIAGEGTKFINNGGKTGGEVKAKVEGAAYKSNNKCFGFVGKEGTNGKYEGNATETGIIVE